MNINLRHLRAIHTIWVQGSFSRAASALGVVPSVLTATVRQLEEEVGAPLFDRRTRPSMPTELGLAFLKDTAPLVEGLDHAMQRLRNHATLHSGTLTIGASPSAISDLVAPALALFRQQHPGIACQLHDDIAETLASMVADGHLDLAIAGRARLSNDLRQTEIERDRFGLACAASHDLANYTSVKLEELDPTTIISLSPETGTQQLLMSCPHLPPSFYQTTLVAHSTIAQLCMIRAGVGIALMPRKAVLLFNDPSIRYIALEDFELWRTLYLIQPEFRTLSRPASLFVKNLQAHQRTAKTSTTMFNPELS